MNKIRIAFVKFGGLAIGGTELYLQKIAVALPRDRFLVDYYYCDAAPFSGSHYKHGDTDPGRLQFMREEGINLVKFHVGAKNIKTPKHDWVGTDFWKVFNPHDYDLVQAGKAGDAEYPFYLMDLPIVELVGLPSGIDRSPNIAWSIHSSPWQRARWVQLGGRADRSSVIRSPVAASVTKDNLRRRLGIPDHHVVAGLLQRADDNIFSPIPLEAFARVQKPDRHFLMMNGSPLYRGQANSLNLKNFHFIEHSPDFKDVDCFYNTLDFFAHGRKDGESYGSVLAEAVMHGKPSLSHYSEGGNNAQPETMGPTGLFAGNMDEYVRHMEHLFSNPTLRERLASKTKAMTEEYFSFEAGMHDIARIYEWVCGRDPESPRPKRMDYGLSSLGFLQAGDLENPKSQTHHVLTGIIPEQFKLHMFRLFSSRVRSMVDFGAEAGLYGFTAAAQCDESTHVYLYEPSPAYLEQIKKSIWLNNWENRVSVVDMTTLSRLEQIDFLRLGILSETNSLFAQIGALLVQHKPIILLECKESSSLADTASLLRQLREAGYLIFRINSSKGTLDIEQEIDAASQSDVFCLHPDKHKEWLAHLDGWATQYRWAKNGEWWRKLFLRLRRGIVHPLRAIRKFYRLVAAPQSHR